jgi:hypothetical protein
VAPRLDSWHGVVARLQANKLAAIRLELETTRAGKPVRSAQGVSSTESNSSLNIRVIMCAQMCAPVSTSWSALTHEIGVSL